MFIWGHHLIRFTCLSFKVFKFCANTAINNLILGLLDFQSWVLSHLSLELHKHWIFSIWMKKHCKLQELITLVKKRIKWTQIFFWHYNTTIFKHCKLLDRLTLSPDKVLFMSDSVPPSPLKSSIPEIRCTRVPSVLKAIGLFETFKGY